MQSNKIKRIRTKLRKEGFILKAQFRVDGNYRGMIEFIAFEITNEELYLAILGARF